jgi:nitrate/TMAO reductase-like tetraheme cytochrome c subunit
MPRSFLKRLLQNPVSFIGLLIAVLSGAVGVPLMLVDLFSAETNRYTGIITYAVLPATTILGFGIAVLGLILEGKRRRGSDLPPWEFPRIDLNQPRQRLVLVGVLAGAMVILVLVALTGYRTYHWTDSVPFCGEVCHSVMKPEYTAYQRSPHARVACVDCHVGPGAGWYLRSKLSGAYQIYSTAFNKYPRPIETPVHDLRPAQETCEQCHWPAKFFGAQQKLFAHTLADEKNTPWQINTLILIGGGDLHHDTGGGIHWHMNIQNDIYYIASDPKHETIPWVRAVSKDGRTTTEYMSTESPLSAEEQARASVRHMDCVDCHNRPSHIYHPPDRSIDRAMETHQLDATLPYLKREGMRLLAGEYKTGPEALAAIEKKLPAFYLVNYPDIAQTKKESIATAVRVLQDIFGATIFPEMKTDWRVHMDHKSHLNSDGCFRCHDGLHKSRDGKTIPHDCNACHLFLAQGSPGAVERARLQAQPFQHPVELSGIDLSTMKCSACHNGTIGL